MPDDHISLEQFWIEWFGPFGRDLGTPKQWFSDNPNDIITLVNSSRVEKVPAFCSVQPRREFMDVLGIEKLFWDFDYGKKSQKLSESQITARRIKLEIEVHHFVDHLVRCGLKPLVVKTRKGYHVYVFFNSIYQINSADFDLWKLVYERMERKYLPRKYKFCDSSVIKDLRRMSRVPYSTHEKSGEVCEIVDYSLKPTKIRSLEFYKTYGLLGDELKREVVIAEKIIEKNRAEAAKLEEEKRTLGKEEWERRHGFVGKIRPCFTRRVEAKEMCHQQRLAYLLELFYGGRKTEDALVDEFRYFNDFDEKTTRYQVNWFLQHHNGSRPYRCEKIEEMGWCLKGECPIYNHRKGQK